MTSEGSDDLKDLYQIFKSYTVAGSALVAVKLVCRMGNRLLYRH